jgi:hypothetical protein
MAVYSYPPEVHKFIKENAPKMRDEELAKVCNEKFGTEFTVSKLKSFRGTHKYPNGLGRWSREEFWKYQTRYPKGMYEFIRDNSWHVSSAEMAEMVNEKFGLHFSPSSMKQFRTRYGIKSGCTGWFQKGHPPANKGKTIEEICQYDPEKIARSKQTRFKKGHRPVNELPIGTVVVNAEGYLLRKKQMEGGQWDRWEHLHRAVWEEHNGPIPEGMMVTFKDNDKSNCSIDNLMLITKGENSALTRLGYRTEDPELTEAGLNVIRLKHKAKELKKSSKRT